MTDIKKIRYREFRLWLINSLQEWSEYCDVKDLVPAGIYGRIMYKHGWQMLKDWAEQDLAIYRERDWP
jgi:hypothetical protein